MSLFSEARFSEVHARLPALARQIMPYRAENANAPSFSFPTEKDVISYTALNSNSISKTGTLHRRRNHPTFAKRPSQDELPRERAFEIARSGNCLCRSCKCRFYVIIPVNQLFRKKTRFYIDRQNSAIWIFSIKWCIIEGKYIVRPNYEVQS